MSASVYALLPWMAAVGFLAGLTFIGIKAGSPPSRHGWMVPAFLSALFFAWSVYTVVVEGPVGFWANHTANAWGNQVWFDLLLAAGTAASFVAPAAKREGMQPWPWLVLIALTGSVGLLAMVSRYLFLRERNA